MFCPQVFKLAAQAPGVVSGALEAEMFVYDHDPYV
jgi:hypothetical protein